MAQYVPYEDVAVNPQVIGPNSPTPCFLALCMYGTQGVPQKRFHSFQLARPTFLTIFAKQRSQDMFKGYHLPQNLNFLWVICQEMYQSPPKRLNLNRMDDLGSKQIGKADWNFKCKPPGLICMWCIADCFWNPLISKWICLQHNSVCRLLQKQGAFFSLSVLLSVAIFIHRAEFQKDQCVSHDYLLNYKI